MKKRILSILLILSMIFSLMSFSAYAEELSFETPDDSEMLREQWLKFLAIQSEEDSEIMNLASMFPTTDSITTSVTDSVYANDLSNEKIDGNDILNEKWMEFLEYLMEENDENSSQASFVSIADTTTISPLSLAFERNQQSVDVSRYTVLVLDVSGSMWGTPMSALKTAANKFCEAVLEADGDNYVAIVTYASGANIRCNFTDDLTALQKAINSLAASGGTNITAGVQYADNLLNAIPNEEGTIKNILLLSDGLPNTGMVSNSGPYSSSDYSYYRYANATYHKATELKEKGYSIYTLGFFHGLFGNQLDFARRFMKDLQNQGYYDVVDPDDLEFVFGEIADNILKRTGKFRYPSDVLGENRDYEATYYYDDKYFFDSSFNYNESLATMSLCLAMSAFASNEKDYPNKSDNARVLLEQIGFSDFRTNSWYTVKPTRDSIGVVAANKKIKVNDNSYTLIAVALRGAGYENEWASNFTMGKTGQHQGFNEAKDEVLRFVREYITNQGISGDIKLWVTGFSRAGGTANLVSGAINRGATLGNVSLNSSGLYAYCFEPPQGAILSDDRTNPLYKNTFNIVNTSDPVPKVAPGAFEFRRYGEDRWLPTPENYGNYLFKRENMLAKYYALESITNSNPYIVDNFAMKKFSLKIERIPYTHKYVVLPTVVDDKKNVLSQGAFLDELVFKLAREHFKSRENYVNEFQHHFRELFGVLTGTEDKQWEEFGKIFEEKLTSNIGWLIASTNPVASLIIGDTTSLIKKYAVESLNEANITEYNMDEIESLAAALSKVVFGFAIKNPTSVATLISNIEGIGSAHYPELCLAWLQSMDKNYTTDAGLSFSTGAYRIIRINCPIDVEVFDSSDNLVASIKSDEPQDLEGSSIISAINEDGEKLIYLPVDVDYNLRLIATDYGLMTYSINEFSSSAGAIKRIINYYDIAIEPGDEFTSLVPAYSIDDITNRLEDGSTIEYSLFDTNNELIVASDDLKGNDASDAYYMVYVTTENEEYGFVTGQGIRQLGNYAQITATPYYDNEFEGWYINDQKVSSEAEYRFRVESDVEIVAKFNGNRPPEVANAAASIPEIWPPNNKMIEIEILNVEDPDGDPVTITITEITQNEPLTNKKEGDAFGIGTDRAWIRASRSGNGNGRVYKISFIASDDRGGESSGYVLVSVPHNQGRNTIILDDGQEYNSVIE